MPQWLKTPAGRLALDWERARLDAAVADVFGFHALQLGLPELDALRANRMPHRWLALEQPPAPGPALHTEPAAGWTAPRRAALVTDFGALPFPSSSLDLIVLPHALESSGDPHAVLRETSRVLVPEGRAVICGLNPASLWGLRERRLRLYRRFGAPAESYLPQDAQPIGLRRLRDWLRLLSFEVESSNFGCWQPAVRSERWLKRLDWIERGGARWWPIFGALYFVVAVKRVRGLRLLGRAARRREARALASAPVPVASRKTPASAAREPAAVE